MWACTCASSLGSDGVVTLYQIPRFVPSWSAEIGAMLAHAFTTTSDAPGAAAVPAQAGPDDSPALALLVGAVAAPVLPALPGLAELAPVGLGEAALTAGPAADTAGLVGDEPE